MNDRPLTSKYRYTILAMLLYATSVNYFDRSIIGVMADTLIKLFHWTNSDYADIIISFQTAYAIGMLVMGNIIDRLGSRKGYSLSIGIWAIFGMLHAAVQPFFSLIGFSVARFGLGFGESGNFPAAIKVVAEWFPKKDRAWATGIFNASTSIGAIAAPFVVGAIVSVNGKNWQIPFLLTGALSSVWVFIWWRIYRKPENHPKVSKQELEYILSDQVEGKEVSTEKVPWKKLVPKRKTWVFALAKITDAVWWFYLFWGAKFLADRFHVNIKHVALPFFILYILADSGSIFGGYLSKNFIGRGWKINKARKLAMLICALIVLPVVFVGFTNNEWIAVLLIGIAAAGHQAWSANLFTLASDLFPKKATASVVGIGGMVGSVASIVANFILGHVLDEAGNHGYFWAFLIAGSVYLIVLGIIHLMDPKMVPLDENLEPIYDEKESA